MMWPEAVTIKEVGPRDGLQNEKMFISTQDKINWINQLSHTGLNYIEVTSFVDPKWIPALADSIEVAKRIDRVDGVTYAALVPNLQGLERAIESNIDEVSVFMSVSQTHNKKNINKTIEETYQVLTQVVKKALVAGKSVRGYVSTVFGCPYEGNIPIHSIVEVSEKLFDMGISELSLGDTIGVANPKQVQEILTVLLKKFPSESLAMHFHNTRGTALANVTASLDMGITTFDCSIGGLGGCPYAPSSSGNLATDELLFMLEGMGIITGVDKQTLHHSAMFIQEKIGRPLSSNHFHAYQGNISFN